MRMYLFPLYLRSIYTINSFGGFSFLYFFIHLIYTTPLIVNKHAVAEIIGMEAFEFKVVSRLRGFVMNGSDCFDCSIFPITCQYLISDFQIFRRYPSFTFG